MSHLGRHLPARSHVLRVVGVVALLLGLVATSPSGAAEPPTERLTEVRDRIEGTIAELDDVAGRAEESEEALAQAEEAVARLETELNEVLDRVIAQQDRVDAAQAESDEAAAELARVEELASERARRAFMGGVPEDLVIFNEVGGGGQLDGVLDRLAFLDAISARDTAAIESMDAVRTRADASAERLRTALADLEEARATQEELLTAAEEVFADREDALASLGAERERLLAQREQLEGEEEDLQALIERQEEERRREEEARRREEQAASRSSSSGSSSGGSSAGGSSSNGSSPGSPDGPPAAPAPSSGCYARPASGAITSEFGPRWGRLHAGMDVDGNTGDAIYAAQSGTVTFVGWRGGYGRITLIRHGDGVTTAYAHQSSVSVSSGQSVSRGQYIGAIGTTGAVTGSHLHFETRTSRGAVNPRNYLC